MKYLRRIALRLSVALVAATAFLLPLKFGGLSGLPEVPGFYPPGILDWLVITWPVQLFPLFSGGALLLAVAGGARRLPGTPEERLFLWLWGPILPAAVLWSGVNSAVADYAETQFVHYLGVGAWCWSVALLIAEEPRRRRLVFSALMWGCALAVLSGWRQYFWGFEETRRYFAEAAANGAAEVGEQLRIKLNDDRVYATFASCNTYAGFLLLAGAALTVFVGALGGRFEPRGLSRVLFGSATAVSVSGILFLTRSRGALLCLVIAALSAFLIGEFRRRIKVAVAVVALFILAGGAWYVQRAGRGFSSGAERLDYLATTAKLVAAHPLRGAGWDGFFREHMRSKRTATDEAAHDPHNFVSAFAAAGGLPAGAVALAALVSPLVLLYRKRRDFDLLRLAVGWGCAAFALHMLMEIDYLTSACLSAFVLLVLFAAVSDGGDAAAVPRTERFCTVAVALTLALTALVSGRQALAGDLAYARFCSVVEPEPGALWRPPSPPQLESALNEILKKRPYSPFALEKAAECYAMLGDLRRAEELLERSLEFSGPRPGPLWKLSEILAAQERRAEAEARRAEAVRLFPSKYLTSFRGKRSETRKAE